MQRSLKAMAEGMIGRLAVWMLVKSGRENGKAEAVGSMLGPPRVRTGALQTARTEGREKFRSWPTSRLLRMLALSTSPGHQTGRRPAPSKRECWVSPMGAAWEARHRSDDRGAVVGASALALSVTTMATHSGFLAAAH